MKCPNCDFIEKDEAFGQPPTCPKCGAIYEKALRVRQLKEIHAKKPQAAAEKKERERQASQQAAEKQQANQPAAKQKSHLPPHVQERIDARVKGDSAPCRPVGIFEHMAQGVDEARAERQREAEETANRKTSSVVITDVKIPFLSLVVLLLKTMIAAIPALIALWLIIIFALGFTGGLVRYL